MMLGRLVRAAQVQKALRSRTFGSNNRFMRATLSSPSLSCGRSDLNLLKSPTVGSGCNISSRMPLTTFVLPSRRHSTLVEVQAATCKMFADRPFIGDRKKKGFEWKTYADFWKDANALAHALHNLGVQKGESVACISKNRYEWAVGNYACLALGAKWVPMYENQMPKDWEHIITDSGSEVVFVSTPQVAGNLVRHWEKEEGAPDDRPALPRIVLFDGPTPETHADDSVLPNVVNYDDVLAFAAAEGNSPASGNSVIEFAENTIDPDDVATIIYTSGTTGKPKGVMLSHRNIIHNLKAMKQLAAGYYDESAVHCAILPWAHAYGQTVELHQAIHNGASIGTSSAATVLDDLQEIKPTILIGVPQVFGRLYDRITSNMDAATGIRKTIAKVALSAAEERREFLDKADRTGLHKHVPSSMLRFRWWLANATAIKTIKSALGGRLSMAMTGGAALDSQIQAFFTDLGIPIIEGYGLTETSPLVVSEKFAATERGQGGLTAVPDCIVAITAPDDPQKVLLPGSEGQITVIGDNVMVGYHANPKATDECIVNIQDRRAFLTGDLGVLNTEGVLRITGRIKEQYKLDNGKFVSPALLESRIALSPFINQIYVEGANRPHNVALIHPSIPALSGVIKGLSPEATTLTPEQREEARKIIRRELDVDDPEIKHYERVVAFELLEEPFSMDNGFLTPKMSQKRPSIAVAFKDAIAKLYEA